MRPEDREIRIGDCSGRQNLTQCGQLVSGDIGIYTGEVTEAIAVSLVHALDFSVCEGLNLGIERWVEHSTELELSGLRRWWTHAKRAPPGWRKRGRRYCRGSWHNHVTWPVHRPS